MNILAPVQRLALLWRVIRAHWGANIIWGSPPQADTLILDAVGADLIWPLLPNSNYVILHIRGEQIYLSWRLLAATIKNMSKVRNPVAAYALSVIQLCKIRLVVTFIDDSGVFHTLAKICKNIEFLAVQNGVRNPAENVPDPSAINHQHFVCLGEKDVVEFSQSGAMVSQFYPWGSLLHANFRTKSFAPIERSFDICIISQISADVIKFYPQRVACARILVEFVAKFCVQEGRSFCIAARSGPNSDPVEKDIEFGWYRAILGEAAEIIPNIHNAFTSYRVMQSCDVMLGLDSTLLYEAFSDGQKALFCNFTENPNFDCPAPGIWSIAKIDFEVFAQNLLKILEMGALEFKNISHTSAQYLMHYDDGTSTSDRVADLIKSLLNDNVR